MPTSPSIHDIEIRRDISDIREMMITLDRRLHQLEEHNNRHHEHERTVTGRSASGLSSMFNYPYIDEYARMIQQRQADIRQSSRRLTPMQETPRPSDGIRKQEPIVKDKDKDIFWTP
jgi:hypothetical protein